MDNHMDSTFTLLLQFKDKLSLAAKGVISKEKLLRVLDTYKNTLEEELEANGETLTTLNTSDIELPDSVQEMMNDINHFSVVIADDEIRTKVVNFLDSIPALVKGARLGYYTI